MPDRHPTCQVLDGTWYGHNLCRTLSVDQGFSVRSLSGSERLREELSQGSMDRDKWILIESRGRRRQDWGLQEPLSQLLIVQTCTALRQQQATQHESSV